MDDIKFNIDETEIAKIKMNRLLFSIHKTDHFQIKDVLSILRVETIPVEIPINNNNTIFIRDLTNYIIDKNLEPYINKE